MSLNDEEIHGLFRVQQAADNIAKDDIACTSCPSCHHTPSYTVTDDDDDVASDGSD